MVAARPEMPTGIEDRDADMWEPLLAIADAAGGDWPNRARDAAVELVGAAKEAEPSLGIKVLADCKTVFDESGKVSLPTSVILASLIELPESPWGDLKGKPINDRMLALRLRQYGIKSRQIRVGDRTVKGYDRADFHDVWIRYLPPFLVAETKQAKQTKQAPENHGVNVSDVSLVGGQREEAPDDGTDPGDIPDDLVRTGHRCNYCGSQFGILNYWDWPGYPDGIRLHPRCEQAWRDSEAPLPQ